MWRSIRHSAVTCDATSIKCEVKFGCFFESRRGICREPHSYQVPAEAKAGAYRSDDQYGHFRNLAARCYTLAVPGMRARPPMETGGCLGGPGSEARSHW